MEQRMPPPLRARIEQRMAARAPAAPPKPTVWAQNTSSKSGDTASEGTSSEGSSSESGA